MKLSTLTNTLFYYLLVGLLSLVPDAAAKKKAPRRLDPTKHQQRKTKSSSGKKEEQQGTCPCASIFESINTFASCCEGYNASTQRDVFEIAVGNGIFYFLSALSTGEGGCGVSVATATQFDSAADFSACKESLSSICSDAGITVASGCLR